MKLAVCLLFLMVLAACAAAPNPTQGQQSPLPFPTFDEFSQKLIEHKTVWCMSFYTITRYKNGVKDGEPETFSLNGVYSRKIEKSGAVLLGARITLYGKKGLYGTRISDGKQIVPPVHSRTVEKANTFPTPHGFEMFFNSPRQKVWVEGKDHELLEKETVLRLQLSRTTSDGLIHDQLELDLDRATGLPIHFHYRLSNEKKELEMEIEGTYSNIKLEKESLPFSFFSNELKRMGG